MRTRQWACFVADPPIRIPLPGSDGKPAAVVEIAVSDGDMAGVLRQLTYTSAGLAIARRLAHEIKNPLTSIQMAMDTLRKTWKKQHPSFGEILEAVLESRGLGGRA